MKQLARWMVVVALGVSVPTIVGAETWVVDPTHTVSGFTVRHMMLTSVSGVFERTRGTIEYKPGDPSSIKADVNIDAKSVNTHIGRRDEHLRGDGFFDTEKFPTMTFKSRRVQNVTSEGFQLVGDLTIRDVTKEVVLSVEAPTPPIKDAQGNLRVVANATTTISRKDFGINWNRAVETGGAVVGDDVKITIAVEAVEKKG